MIKLIYVTILINIIIFFLVSCKTTSFNNSNNVLLYNESALYFDNLFKISSIEQTKLANKLYLRLKDEKNKIEFINYIKNENIKNNIDSNFFLDDYSYKIPPSIFKKDYLSNLKHFSNFKCLLDIASYKSIYLYNLNYSLIEEIKKSNNLNKKFYEKFQKSIFLIPIIKNNEYPTPRPSPYYLYNVKLANNLEEQLRKTKLKLELPWKIPNPSPAVEIINSISQSNINHIIKLLRTGGIPVYKENYLNGSENYIENVNALDGFKGVIHKKNFRTFSGIPEFSPKNYFGIFSKEISYFPLGCKGFNSKNNFFIFSK